MVGRREQQQKNERSQRGVKKLNVNGVDEQLTRTRSGRLPTSFLMAAAAVNINEHSYLTLAPV